MVSKPSLDDYWKFNTSLQEIRDLRERLETLIQRVIVGEVTGNKWWGFLKYRIKDFAIKYDKQLNLDRAKMAKSLDDRLSLAVERGVSLTVHLARRDLEREASERYKGFVVRSKLKRVPNKAGKCSAFARKEGVRRFPYQNIEFMSLDGYMLRSNRETRGAFWAHFHDRFARCPDHLVQEFCSYLADFPRLQEAEAASCEGLVTEWEVRDALKQVSLNKSSRLDGLPYEVYIRMSHMFVLTDYSTTSLPRALFQVAFTKGVITLRKRGGRHVWDDLDDFGLLTLLNTKILVRFLGNRLQLVISDLIGPEQNYSVKGRSIPDNLHQGREVLEDTKAVLINLDQSKAFDRVDHRFLATVLETAGFKSKFRKWISMLYHDPQVRVQVNGEHLKAFELKRSVRQSCALVASFLCP